METRVKVSLAANRRRTLLFVFILVPLALILLLRSLGFTLQQPVILIVLVLTILWWVTGVVKRAAASLFLLAAFLLRSGASVQTAFFFPLSENFVLIVVSFLFSQGISNSGPPGKLLQPFLAYFVRSPRRMVFSFLLFTTAMTFLILQPFSRITTFSLIYRKYSARINLLEPLHTTLLSGLYYFSILINMFMIQGDTILNGALPSMIDLTVNEGVRTAYILAPTSVYLLAAVFPYQFLFRGMLRILPSGLTQTVKWVQLTGSERYSLVFLLAMMVPWVTEDSHPFTGTLVVAAITALMPPLGLLCLLDIKATNARSLILPMVAFAIGGILKSCGVADRLFPLLVPVFLQTFSPAYAVVILSTVVLLHTMLGSNITAMSVVAPGLISIGIEVTPPPPLMSFTCIAVCSQFLLPSHHVVLLLGEGDRCYSTYGPPWIDIPRTAFILFIIFLLYLPQWRPLGALQGQERKLPPHVRC